MLEYLTILVKPEYYKKLCYEKQFSVFENQLYYPSKLKSLGMMWL